jgi:hypothetical protein
VLQSGAQRLPNIPRRGRVPRPPPPPPGGGGGGGGQQGVRMGGDGGWQRGTGQRGGRCCRSPGARAGPSQAACPAALGKHIRPHSTTLQTPSPQPQQLPPRLSRPRQPPLPASPPQVGVRVAAGEQGQQPVGSQGVVLDGLDVQGGALGSNCEARWKGRGGGRGGGVRAGEVGDPRVLRPAGQSSLPGGRDTWLAMS